MMRNKLFPLIMNYNAQVSSFTIVCSIDYQLWNFQFGHLHFSSLILLEHKQMVRGLPPIKESSSTSECCILGKQHHEIFPKGVGYKEKQPLELVHTNLYLPMRTQQIDVSCYFLTFIDDFCKKTWVYLLKQRSETFTKFKEFKAFAEKKNEHQIKVLRSYRGGEYDSKEFHAYCKQHGIRRKFNTRYTSQQNWRSREKEHNHYDMARSMLKGRNLSNEYLEEVVACIFM